jgi:adenylate cyclase
MKNKNLLILGILLFVIFIEIILSNSSSIFERLEFLTYDLRSKFATDKGPFSKDFKPADKNIVIVTVDESSKKELSKYPEIDPGSWPWSRDVWSGIVDFIEKGKPKAILFDIIFANLNENFWNDRTFAQTLNKYDNIVLATALNTPKYLVDKHKKDSIIENSNYLPTPKPLDIKINNKKLEDKITFYSHSPIPDLYTRHNTMGVVNKVMYDDSVIRKSQPVFKLIKNNQTYYLPSLAFAGFLKYMGGDGKIIIKDNKITYKKRVIPIDETGETNISWHGTGNDYHYIPVSKILLSQKNQNYKDIDYFKNKIVIIGHTEAGTDIHPSAVNPSYAGPEANATALDNFINDSDLNNKSARKFIYQLPIFLEYLFIIIFCLFLALLGIFSKNAFLGFINSVVFIIFYLLLCMWMFANPHIRIWMPIIKPLYYFLATSGIIFAFKFQKEIAKRASVTNMFGKFVSPKVLSTLLKNENNLVLKNTKKRITMMFCDIKDFTTLSEKCNPEQLIDNMNELFNKIVNVIFENNGTVDKFIGDCVMAYWGDPVASDDDAYMAVKTALQIKKAVNELKVQNAREQKIILDVKIGINTGDALLGLSGSEKIMSYTAMGDAVNVASRLESNCSKLNRDILISKSTYEDVKTQVVVLEAGKIKVKGRVEEIEVYEPIALIEELNKNETSNEITEENDR